MTKPRQKPKALQTGDLVQIVAPASNLKAEYLLRGVAELTSLGLRVKYDPDILEKDRYTAGTDERRRRELTAAFTDPEVKAVWAAGQPAARPAGFISSIPHFGANKRGCCFACKKFAANEVERWRLRNLSGKWC